MADGSRFSLFAVEESTYGTTPASPALDTVRITSGTPGLTKDSLQSEEIRSDRQIADFRLGANQIGNSINFELSYGSFDQFLEGVLLSADFASPATTGTTTIDATATGYSRAAGSFVTDGFKVGQTVVASGYVGSGYNGKSTVTSVSALSMDTTPFTGGTHGVESGDGDELIVASESIASGLTRKSFTFIGYHSDVAAIDNPYYIYRGCELNQVDLTISANSIITGTFTVVGASQTLANDLTALGTPTYNAVSTTAPLDSFTGALIEGGTTIAVVTEVTLSLVNGIAPRFVVGSKNSILPSLGRSNLTGQITAYFENSDLVEKFINETSSDLEINLPDGAGNIIRLRVPRLLYTGGQPEIGGEGPVTLTMPFQATLSTTEGTNLIIERIPA